MIRRLLALFASVLVLALGSTVTPAYADEEAGMPDMVNRWYNGCTVDIGPYDFEAACNWHDLCYGGVIANHSKGNCDRIFHEYMDTICMHQYGLSSGCLAWAGVYYAGVGFFGWGFWDPTWYCRNKPSYDDCGIQP